LPKQWYGPAARAERNWRADQQRYTSRALEEAGALGHSWVGSEHLLLALVAPGGDSIAARALRDSGVEYEALHAELSKVRESVRTKAEWRTFPPSFYVLGGRADGLARGLGAKRIGPEHLLLAILWEPHGRCAGLLETLGTSGAKVQRKLAKLGAMVPTGRPPGVDDTRWGDFVTLRVPSNDAWELASLVRQALPEGAPIGFNFNRTTVWFHSGEGIDLAPIVRKARRRQLAHRRKHPPEELQPPAPRR
jgi:hypothetical protein